MSSAPTASALSAEALVLATPAYVSAELVRPLSPFAGGLLDMIPYASTATISLIYPADAVSDRLQGFGFVVPRIEGRDLIAATWTSRKWPHRAPPQEASVRCYLGGVGREAILERDDEALAHCVRAELAATVGLQATPHYVEVNRWHRAMPQYTIGHLDRLRSWRQRCHDSAAWALRERAIAGWVFPTASGTARRWRRRHFVICTLRRHDVRHRHGIRKRRNAAMLNDQLVISDVTGPFREPREPVFSYDYSIQRATWAATHAVRVKIAWRKNWNM